jgi:indole-3-glycerol phosphate synthase
MSILDEIFAHKRVEVAERKAARPLAQVPAAVAAAAPALDFTAALRMPGHVRLIAEIKRASPSKGIFALHLDTAAIYQTYAQNGAAAVSVLTDEHYFRGSLAALQTAAVQTPRLPLLRKDFICDPYQVYEARAAGADAILLIAAMLDLAALAGLHRLANDLGMAALVEVHTEAEVEAALSIDPVLIGINNRDLHDFSVRLETSRRLRRLIPAKIVIVAESGIHTAADVACLAEAGIDAVLVGEALVTAADPAAKVRELSGAV